MEGIEPSELWRETQNRNTVANLEKRHVIPDSVAVRHARLLRPLPFDQFGCIYFFNSVLSQPVHDDADYSDSETYAVGPFLPHSRSLEYQLNLTWPSKPYKDLRQFWRDVFETDVAEWRQRWDAREDIITHKSKSGRWTRADIDRFSWKDFSDATSGLRTLIERCSITGGILHALCWINPLSLQEHDSRRKIIALLSFLDWDNVWILPFILGTPHPHEFCERVCEIEWTESGHFNFIPLDEHLDSQAKKDIDDSLRRLFTDLLDDTNGYDWQPIPDLGEKLSRVHDTLCRAYYAERLSEHDRRILILPGFWKLREEMMKVHFLVTHGLISWLNRLEWLKAQKQDK